MSKINTNPRKPALSPITPEPNALPFQTIALDFIVKLPESEGFDTILTITNHDCSKAAMFMLCNETVDAAGVAKLYATYVFPHDGLPPPDRWPKREDEPIPRAVPTLVLWDSPKGLGSMVTAGPIHPELLAKRVDQENPLRTYFGLHPTGIPTYTRHHGPRYRHTHAIDQGRKRASTRCPQADTRTHDQGNKV